MKCSLQWTSDWLFSLYALSNLLKSRCDDAEGLHCSELQCIIILILMSLPLHTPIPYFRPFSWKADFRVNFLLISHTLTDLA